MHHLDLAMTDLLDRSSHEVNLTHFVLGIKIDWWRSHEIILGSVLYLSERTTSARLACWRATPSPGHVAAAERHESICIEFIIATMRRRVQSVTQAVDGHNEVMMLVCREQIRVMMRKKSLPADAGDFTRHPTGQAPR